MWHPVAASNAFDHVLFRKVIALDHVPISAQIAVTASCVYRAIVNGRFLMQGPARSLAGSGSVDIVSITDSLQIGLNVLALEAIFAHHWQAGFYGEAPGAFAAVQINGEVLDALSGWTCFRPGAYDVNAPRCGNSRPPVEIFNAMKIDPGWKTKAFHSEAENLDRDIPTR